MLRQILDSSEIWAIFFPVIIFFKPKYKEKYIQIVAAYLFIALLLNTTADVLRIYNRVLSGFLKYNNWLYNIHSIVRTLLFILFFQYANNNIKYNVTRAVVILFVMVSVSVFTIFKVDFFLISSTLLTLEGIILLIYCVAFFLQRLKDEELYLDFDAPLIITTGLTIYEGINFFIFLFYSVLMNKEKSFAINIWDVHNVSFIIFCAFISYAFYGRPKLVHH